MRLWWLLGPGIAIAAAAPATRPALVVHVGNDPAALHRFEAWLGCPVDGVGVYGGQADWADWSGSIGYELGLWRAAHRRLYWSIPLIPEGASLANAARGDFDRRYAAAAAAIAAGTPGTAPILIRTGWEFNTPYMPWAAAGHEAAFVGAWRHFVGAFRHASPRFRFEWTPNLGGDEDPARAYPGDGVVDVIGMDAYYNTRWDSTDAARAWRHNVERRYGLAWLEGFAAAHRKPTAYSEWGVMADGAGPYVAAAAAWFAGHRTVYQAYWDSDSTFPGKLSTGRLPHAGAAYRAAFGRCRGVSQAQSVRPERSRRAGAPCASTSLSTNGWRVRSAGVDSSADHRRSSRQRAPGATIAAR